jgi:2',3'-cyclic-nucleotide 2'-phosphodiesterase (5'-nucleotidase family)
MTAVRRLAAFVCLGLAVALATAAHAQNATKVTFILVNDIYSMGDTLMPDGKRRGGFARLAAVVKAERAKGGHVLLAHGGDTLSPSLMSGIDKGQHIVTLTNMVPPDIFTPGNHEFDFGKDIYLQRMAEARFPVYAANIRDAEGKALPKAKDRDIVTFDGVRIGLTGVGHDETPKMSSPETLTFAPTVKTAIDQSKALRAEGADFVVAVLHANRAQGYALAAANSTDLILTGHNHDLFINYDGSSAMVESSYDAHFVTAIDVDIRVTMQDGKRQTAWWPQFRVIDTAAVAPDPAVAAKVSELEAELSREMDVPLATTAVELDSRNATVRLREAAIGNVIADAMRDKTGAVAAVTNGGGIRAGKVYAPGTAITRRDVLAELPFGNRVMVIDISGADLKTALEGGFGRLPEAAGRFPQVSGMTIEYDVKRAVGDRIVSIRIGGAPLDPARTYHIATNDFLARGSDGYVPFGAAKSVLPADDAPLLANEVMVYLRKLGTVTTKVEGRIVAK